jgi:hypothetical protein
MAKTLRKPTRSGKTFKAPKGTVLSITKDGVRILNQGRPTHFTSKELREAVRSVQAAKRAG